MQHHDVVIVGAGHAGAQAAIALRQHDFQGSLALIGDEPHLPYERPPLSKDYLAGTKPFARILLRPETFWAERRIDMLLGEAVVRVDAAQRRLTRADGTVVHYGKLIWATGGRARKLACPGHDLAGVHTIRTRSDVDRLVAGLEDTQDIVVIGGGYIGLEVAAVLTKLGKSVTVLEAQDHVLARVAGAPLSRFYEAHHRTQGVRIRLGTTVARLEGNGSVSGVRLADGEIVPCGMVIVGIGIEPAIEPLAPAGVAVDQGILVDAYCRTSLPDIFAIGDCAVHESRFAGDARVRLESVQNANDQAMTVAKMLCGAPAPYEALPWFWSNQFDLKLQTVGLSRDHDDLVVRGDPATGVFSIVYLKAGRVIALDCVNSVKDYVQGKALVLAGAKVDPACLADATIPLKDIAAGLVS